VKPIILLLLLGWAAVPSAQAKDFLFNTVASDPVPADALRSALHVQYLRSPSIGSAKHHGHQLLVPVSTLSLGLGEHAEIWVYFPFFQYLNDERAGITKWDGGDLEFYTKVKLYDERTVRPGIAFVFGLKGAATNPPLGTDEQDFYNFLTFSKHFERFELHGNFGSGLLGNIRNDTDQAHTMLARLMVRLPLADSWRVGIELDSRTRLDGPWYHFHRTVNDDLNRATFGVGGDYHFKKNSRLGAKLTLGLNEESETFGVMFGFEHQLDDFFSWLDD